MSIFLQEGLEIKSFIAICCKTYDFSKSAGIHTHIYIYVCIYIEINRYVKQDTTINTIPDFLSQFLKEHHYNK